MFWMRSTCPLTPPDGSGAPGGPIAGVGRNTSSEKLASCEPCQRGHADQIETVLRGLERERGLAVAFGLLTADRIELRAHGVVDVDRGVELAAGREVERDPLRARAGAGCTRRSWSLARRTRIRLSPVRCVAPTVVPLIDAGKLWIDLRVGPFVVGGGGHRGSDRRARCGLRKRRRSQPRRSRRRPRP